MNEIICKKRLLHNMYCRYLYAFIYSQNSFIPPFSSHPQVEYRRKSVDIVQPPAGFEDSPKPIHKSSTPKHSRKMEKRFRSEERNHHARMMEAQRAKSEERHREEQKENIR